MKYLYLDGKMAVIKPASIPLNSENPYFTKSSVYTFNIELSLLEPLNQLIFGIINRHDIHQKSRRFSSVLIADGRIITRGEAVISSINEESVSIQLLSGNSLLNNNIGKLYIDELDMGIVERDHSFLTYPNQDVLYFPIINSTIDSLVNVMNFTYNDDFSPSIPPYNLLVAPQPYLCFVIRKIVETIGYNLVSNDIENTILANIFIANSSITRFLSGCLPHWTINDFFTELENFAGVIVLVSNENKDITIKSIDTYYDEEPVNLPNVVDEFEAEIELDESASTADNIGYDLPESDYNKYEKFADSILAESIIEEVATTQDAINRFTALGDEAYSYIMSVKGKHYIWFLKDDGSHRLLEYNSFRNLVRNSTNEQNISLKIVPVMFELAKFPILDARRYPPTQTGETAPVLTMISAGSTVEYDSRPRIDNGRIKTSFKIYEQIEDAVENNKQSIDKMCVAFWDGVYFDSLLCQFQNLGEQIIRYASVPFPFTVPKHIYYLLGTACNSEALGRTWSLELNSVDGRETVGSICHLNRLSIDKSTLYTKRFNSKEIPDIRKKFVVHNKQFVCLKITTDITDDGIDELQEGSFYMIND